MKVFVLTTRIPCVDAKGDQLVAFHRISGLMRSGHDVRLLCCLLSRPTDKERIAINSLVANGVAIELIVLSKILQIFNLITSIYKRIPFQAGIFDSARCRQAIARIVDKYSPDVVYAVLFRLNVNLEGLKAPLVVDLIDSLALSYLRASNSMSLLPGCAYRVEARRCLRYERALAADAAVTLVVSEHDAAYIGYSGVKVLKNGVDLRKFRLKKQFTVKKRVIFHGNMDYRPNIVAVTWFCRECWPQVLDQHQDAEFVICGSSPSAEVMRLESSFKGVVVTGRVNCVSTELQQSRVSIAPMRSGAGIQNKILEAMATGLPVVATSLGLGGIGAVAGHSVIVADEAASFSNAIIMLLSDEGRCLEVGSNAHRFVKENHSWESVSNSFVQMIKMATQHPRELTSDRGN